MFLRLISSIFNQFLKYIFLEYVANILLQLATFPEGNGHLPPVWRWCCGQHDLVIAQITN